MAFFNKDLIRLKYSQMNGLSIKVYKSSYNLFKKWSDNIKCLAVH